MSRVIAIIPARWASTRFPGKPLALLGGKAIVLRVVERAQECRLIDEVAVATDDERISRVVSEAGYKAVMTSKDHASGTDRIAEAAESIDAEIVVNIQGDEPMIDPESVDRAVKALLDDPELNVSTLAVPITQKEEFENPNVVKVVADYKGNALYFSRSAIPHNRGELKELPMMKHLGLYAYRRKFLLSLASKEPSPLEKAEQLEQLRILQNGFAIKVLTARQDSIGIDTPDDLKRAEELINV